MDVTDGPVTDVPVTDVPVTDVGGRGRVVRGHSQAIDTGGKRLRFIPFFLGENLTTCR